MPPPTTAEAFLDLVRRSGTADDSRLAASLMRGQLVGALSREPAGLAEQFVRDGVLTAFQAEQLRQGKWRGFTIGKYKVLERLGSGTTAAVYLCEFTPARRRVAVKVLPGSHAADAARLQRFHREARALAALNHPNVVRGYDVDQQGDLHFLVMEHVDGNSLRQIVEANGPMDEGRAAHYVRQAALGLRHAHEQGVLHLDVEPGNVMVDRRGGVKVIDLSQAQFALEADDPFTGDHDAAQETAADSLAVGGAVIDVYGLGATFYFCLTGQSPFGERAAPARHPTPISSVRPEVPHGLVTLIERMMARDPRVHYRTMHEVAAVLEPYAWATIAPPPEHEMPRYCRALGGQPGS